MFTSNATDESSSSRDQGGSSLALVLVPDEFTVGTAGPWFGLLNDTCDHYKIFAIEFDISHGIEFGDPNDDHVRINLGTIVSMKTADLSETTVALHDGSVHRAWINYDGSRKWIDVYLGANNGHVPNLTIESLPLDLSGFLNEFMFVGFSPPQPNQHKFSVLSWNFSSAIEAFPQIPSERTCKRNLIHQVSKFNLIEDIAKALSFLHSKGTIHGNLRTSSMFLDISYEAVLVDYALLTIVAKSNRGENAFIGKRKDVFGFGMMVLEIVAGKRSVSVG
ncbi:hypothetical protein NL676_010236 [Syzygium grande]|nr:hypothetical protein NL676_010236 [Syzygium grande]